MQHRGQESAGIVTLQGDHHYVKRGLGLVSEVFNEGVLAQMPGRAAIGHVRYSTTGMNQLSNAGPLTAGLLNGPVAVAHNGNIVNADVLRGEIKAVGGIFQGSNDTEVILHLLARHPSSKFRDAVMDSLPRLEGAYSFTMLSHRALVAARDSYGFRPLILGKMDNGESGIAYVIASETCAFDLIGAQVVREIEPGEVLFINGEMHSEYLPQKLSQKRSSLARCVFEHVYFARPDSTVFSQSVYEVRKRAGQVLARETGVPADVVVPVPDSGVPAAIGYAHASGIPFEFGIIRNHYVGRTFIQPAQEIRDFGVKIKLNPQPAILQGKRVILIDDSLVRGTTSRKIVALVRSAGAREVHLRIAAPPTTGPCYYGVDTPDKSELIASRKSLEEIRGFVGADTLSYLSLAGLQEAVGAPAPASAAKASGGQTTGSIPGYCAACFDGHYPTDLFGLDKKAKERA